MQPVSTGFEGDTMNMSRIQMLAELDDWLFSVRLAMIHQHIDWHFSMVLAGFHVPAIPAPSSPVH